MTTQTEYISSIRDAAHLNAHALDLVGAEAQAHFADVRLWPESSAKRDILQQLAALQTAYENGQREAAEMEQIATEALQSASEDPVPPPPDYGDIPSGVVWSSEDW